MKFQLKSFNFFIIKMRNIFLKLNMVYPFRMVGVHSGGVPSGGLEKTIEFRAN